MPSIGILGGSFNPPHLGHLALARHAREQLRLERVVLMPLHTPTHRSGEDDPGPAHRLAMCRLAVEGEPGIEACDLEIRRGGPSYTVDTLREIHAAHPEDELTFIVGADTARTLPSWRNPEAVLELARLAVAGRPGTDREEILAAIGEALTRTGRRGGAEPAERNPRVVFLSMPAVEASSTLARRYLASGADASGNEELLSPAVRAYVAEHGLYRRAPGEETRPPLGREQGARP